VIETEGLVERSARAGELLMSALRDAGMKGVVEVRGLGLLVAVELTEPRAADVVAACLARGLVVNNVTPSTIRLAPPLVVTDAEIAHCVEILAAVLNG
jgi:acetylornithine/N-succinyldiaminopimelate aminotransferase